MHDFITQYLVGGFDENCAYTCVDTTKRQAVIVDPSGDISDVLNSLPTDTQINAIWITHTHPDHYDGVADVYAYAKKTVPLYVHELGATTLRAQGYEAIHELQHNDVCSIGDRSYTVLHTPGHSEDSVCFFFARNEHERAALISGDTLFVQGCGRTTPEAAETLYNSLQQLKTLPPETTIYPGHNYGPVPFSTLEGELLENRFLRADDFEAFYRERFPTQ